MTANKENQTTETMENLEKEKLALLEEINELKTKAEYERSFLEKLKVKNGSNEVANESHPLLEKEEKVSNDEKQEEAISEVDSESVSSPVENAIEDSTESISSEKEEDTSIVEKQEETISEAKSESISSPIENSIEETTEPISLEKEEEKGKIDLQKESEVAENTFEQSNPEVSKEDLLEIIKELNAQAEGLRALVVPKKEATGEIPKQSLKEKAELREKAKLLKEEMNLKYKKIVAEDGTVTYVRKERVGKKISTSRGQTSTIATEELPIGERKERLRKAKEEELKLQKERERKEIMEQKKVMAKPFKNREVKAAAYAQIIKGKTEAEKKAEKERSRIERIERERQKKQLKQQLIQDESYSKQMELKDKPIAYLATRAAAINIFKDIKYLFKS